MNSLKQSLSWGKEALQEEAKCLQEAAEKLDDNFHGAVEAILKAKGKLVITGLGKSGHVAKKISATFSSSGTPSFYLHPGEALHGDLGVFEKEDLLLVIAYSGETYETLKVAKFAKSMGITVISITGKPSSNLNLLSDFNLDGSVKREVCPNELAPTSSTTVAMALGDALAVSLIKARAFGPRDFAKLHPEGLLGRRLSLVRDFTKKDLKPLREESSFNQVLKHMSDPNYGICVLASSEGFVQGVITDGDVRRFLLEQKSSPSLIKAKDVMTKNPKHIQEISSALEAARIMENCGISSLVVKNNEEKFSGILRLQDLLAAKIL